MNYGKLALILLLILLLFCVFCALMTQRYTRQVLSLLEAGFSYGEAGRFSQAADHVRQAQALWDAHTGFWGVVLRHTEADQALTGFQSALLYAETQEESEFLSACAQLIASIRHIAEMELPHYYNVLTKLPQA